MDHKGSIVEHIYADFNNVSQLRLKKYLLLKTSPLGRVIWVIGGCIATSCYNMVSNSYCPTDTDTGNNCILKI